MNNLIVARKLNITGVVQGVGFRPFLFQLAHRYGLKGEVFNTFKGVTLTVEGSLQDIENFQNDITEKKPPLSIISEINSRPVPVLNYKDFSISISSSKKTAESSELCINTADKDSANGDRASKSTLISPDVSVCADCLQEMQNPNDRRFGYPFINCTNCGPRYTIIKDIPYDRPKTSMNVFIMCQECQKEYDNPFDRRFHAQPNACPVCGPHLFLVDKSGKTVADDRYSRYLNDAKDKATSLPLELAAELLKQGKVLAVKGLGGFHLAVDAMNPDAVVELRIRKKRPHKPFALMAKSVDVVSDLVSISSEERQILESHHRPIVLLARKKGVLYETLGNNDRCSLSYIAPNNHLLGIMLPYTPLHYLLLESGPSILVMTSGNRSEEPLSIENQDALDAFAHIADYFLLHNRDIYFRADDSIIQVQNHIPRFFRRSRGYAPLPIILSQSMPSDTPVLGCGAGLKNTVCLASGNMAFMSQHIGNLENEKSFAFYKNSINHLKKILNIEPKIIAHDFHPDYLSTKFANLLSEKPKKESGNLRDITLVPVWHHHAHAVSCMAENGLEGNVIAITLDGTGLGTDGNIWGGEMLVCNETSFERKAHLQYIPMPGGDAAVKEPWRMAVSYLYAAFGEDVFDLEIPFLKEIANNSNNKLPSNKVSIKKFTNSKLSDSKIAFIVQMIRKKLNCPLTSSCGRLFDAVASICSIRHEITFESQAAIELQAKSALHKNGERYDFIVDKISDETLNGQQWVEQKPGLQSSDIKAQQPLIINLLPCIREIVKDIHNSTSVECISSKFHQTVIDSFVCATENISLETGIKRVVLSGGVFNNMLILTGMTHALEKKDFKVYSHSKVPSGDGGISLGQVVVARSQMMRDVS